MHLISDSKKTNVADSPRGRRFKVKGSTSEYKLGNEIITESIHELEEKKKEKFVELISMLLDAWEICCHNASNTKKRDPALFIGRSFYYIKRRKVSLIQFTRLKQKS